MKETKVYVGRRNGKHAELMQRLDKALKEQHFAFVFTKQELKDHDRELVKEVCEKIRKYFIKHTFASIDEKNVYECLDEIEKEFEK